LQAVSEIIGEPRAKRMNIADQIIANLDEMLEAHSQLRTPSFLTTMEKQKATVSANSDRCTRCGNIRTPLFPGAGFCAECIELFRRLDYEAHGRFMWFSHMLEQWQNQNKSSKNTDKIDE